ncbi:MAG: glycerophosphodiester phosphodiesterase family protein [Boseongicola sp.]|nr:glycerophosphodiester phosphodiesterase family protein [Boseongicola sp.]
MNGEKALQKPATTLAERFRNPNGNPGEVFVMAHRGAFLDEDRVILPENSVPAIERARRIGCDFVEIDVQFTSDGTAVVMHDTTLDRTTAARGEVASCRHSDLREVPLVHPETRQEFAARIPTLEEAFLALGDEMLVNVELKTGIEAIPEIARIAADAGVSGQLTVKSNLGDATRFERVAEIVSRTPHPVDFIPVLVDSRDGLEGMRAACETLSPNCVECIVDYGFGKDAGYNLLARRGMTIDGGPLFSLEARRIAAGRNLRLFVNTLFVNPHIPGHHHWNGGRSCELGRIAPDSVYGFWIAHGASVIQTDDAPFVLDWLKASGFRG